MNWEQIRQEYPHQWVVVEAVNAATQGSQRVIDQLTVMGVFEDWENAWKSYTSLHNADKWREYYMLHTDRVELNIGVMESFGRVSSNT